MIIGIAGCKRSGKDTIARIIQSNDIYEHNFYGQDFLTDRLEFIENSIKDDKFFTKWNLVFPSKWERHAFADKLKQCLSIVTGYSYKNFFSEPFKNSKCIFTKDGINLTNRQLLQQFGTNVCRLIDEDFWIKALFIDYADDKNWIIPDVRYENEANIIKDKGGILIKVNKEIPTNEHSSETGLENYNKFDYIIDNNESIIDLILKILSLNI